MKYSVSRAIIMTSIREVKKEIRVLGLASLYQPETRIHEIVAVIFRGKFWLDGVIKTRSKNPEITDKVIHMIITSNHHPQIRVILVNREFLPDTNLDLRKLSAETERPLIAIGFQKYLQEELSSCEWRKTPISFIGLEEQTVQKILNVSSKREYPEALRIARLIVESFKQN
jgi:endonuclease V-like protein UPF0215 family